MRPEEYASLDGLELAKQVRNGNVSQQEVLAAAREAIAATNTKLNFLVGKLRENVDQDVKSLEPDATFHGVPSLIKDVGPRMAGMPQELGSAMARGLVPKEDSELTKRFKRAGLIFLGRSSTPEFGGAFTTEPRVNGPTRNPWDVARSTGGSSGGAAAAVAAGAVPIAQAGDTAGSIRVPAHCCGVFGFKPTRGRNPVGPEAGEVNSGLTAAHVLSRTVQDSAAILDATAGPDAGCRYYLQSPKGAFLSATKRDPSLLRIAFCKKSPFGTAVSANVMEATEKAAALCQELGHHVEEAGPQADINHVADIIGVLLASSTYHNVTKLAKTTGREVNESTLETSSLAFYHRGQNISADEFLTALYKMNTFSRSMGAFFEKYDVLLLPTMSQTAPMLGEIHTNDSATNMDDYLRQAFIFCPFTAQFNVTGQPAMSVPLYESTDGLPMGVQFAARFGQDETLFSLAGQLERAVPWRHRRPAIAADRL